MNFYKHYLGDYGRKTAHLSLNEEGAYRRLLDHYYGTLSPLPHNMESLYRIARAFGLEEKRSVCAVAEQFFKLDADGMLHNKRADEEIARWKRQAEINRELGRKGGRTKSELETDSVSDSETDSASEQEPSPEVRSQKLETISQKPKKRERGNGAARFAPPTLPEVREYCEGINSIINPVTFFNHYESVGWKVGKNPMKDWKAAVRGWNSREGK